MFLVEIDTKYRILALDVTEAKAIKLARKAFNEQHAGQMLQYSWRDYTKENGGTPLEQMGRVIEINPGEVVED